MGEPLDTLIRPGAIAVIGASEDPTKWGNRLVRNTVALGYPGRLWTVNPRHQVRIEGSEYAATLADIGQAVDLAVAAAEKVIASKADAATQQALFSQSVGQVKARLN